MNFIDYVKGAFKELPAHRWSGTSATGTLEVSEHSAGIDLARGPWVKFKFREDSQEHELQGFKSWQGTDRIKFGPVGAMAEVDDDRLTLTGAADIPDAKLLDGTRLGGSLALHLRGAHLLEGERPRGLDLQ